MSDTLAFYNKTAKVLGDLNDLPEELLSELIGVKERTREQQLIEIIDANDGTANLDCILIGLYQTFGVIEKRRSICNRLYRMDEIWSVEGRKGFYRRCYI